MKKLIGMFITLLLLSSEVSAYNYNADFKEGFYDGLITNLFQTLQQNLISQGFKQESVYMYVSTLRARLDRKNLEKASWACVSKYTPEQMQSIPEKIINECFDNWSNKFFFEENADTIKLLK